MIEGRSEREKKDVDEGRKQKLEEADDHSKFLEVMDEKMNKRPPRKPRWSDRNMALHIWRGVCRKKGLKYHKYVIRPTKDYLTMPREEVRLDMLWRKVYKSEGLPLTPAPPATLNVHTTETSSECPPTI